MKLVRYGAKGAEKPGLIDKSGQLRDLSAHVKDLDGAAYSPESLKKLAAMPGIEQALSREEACAKFELPEDRIGDIVIVSTKHKVLGTSAARHDLSGLNEPLRSHGGVSEQKVPLLCNRPLSQAAKGRWRNFDAFDLAFNYVR